MQNIYEEVKNLFKTSEVAVEIYKYLKSTMIYGTGDILYIYETTKEADRKQEIIVGYDKLEDKDMSCLIIAKRIDEHIVVQEMFCGKDADVANRAVKMFKGNYIYKKEGYSNYEKE